MNPELENLIEMAVAKGEITDKEREVILNKAETVGENKDEVEIILNGKLSLINKEAAKPQEDQKVPPLNKPLLIIFLVSILGMLISPFLLWGNLQGIKLTDGSPWMGILSFVFAFLSLLIVVEDKNRLWGILGPLLSVGLYALYYSHLTGTDNYGNDKSNYLNIAGGFWLGFVCSIASLILAIILFVVLYKDANRKPAT